MAGFVDTVVVGGGQAGLAIGYHLARRGRDFVIFDAHRGVGDSWRNRWDSLRLFTPAGHDGLPGLPFPADRHAFPAKDQMADYLAEYARRFDLPVRGRVTVDRLTRHRDRFLVHHGGHRTETYRVVVATGPLRVARVPRFAGELDPSIAQLDASRYRRPANVPDGPALVVGAGNSGAEIALDLAAARPVFLSGRDTGQIPIRLVGSFWWFAHNLLTVDTRTGRLARRRVLSHGTPLIRATSKTLTAAGIRRVPRTVGVRGGLPLLEDGRTIDVSSVVWCTGFSPDYTWIDLPVLGADGHPVHRRGVTVREPRLCFVGLPFQYAFTSAFIGGVGRDAEYVADHLT